VTDPSADEMVERLRHCLHKLLRWAEAYQPWMLHERAQYDADLDEAGDLLGATDAWILLNADQWPRSVRKAAPKDTAD
jgi:hypothetical protein